MTNMNSRIRRRFKAMGFDIKEGVKVNYTPQKISWNDSNREYGKIESPRQKKNANQKNIIQQAKNMYLGGKHLGSKPLQTIKNRIRGVSELVGNRRAYINAVKAAQEALKAQEAENVIEHVEEVTVENVN